MTLRSVQVNQNDPPREFHASPQKLEANRLHLPLLLTATEPNHDAGISAVFQSMATSRQLLEMRRRLPDGKLRRKLERLANRFLEVIAELETLFPAER